MHVISNSLDKSEDMVTVDTCGNWLELRRHCPPQPEYLTPVLLQSPPLPTAPDMEDQHYLSLSTELAMFRILPTYLRVYLTCLVSVGI